MQTKVKPTTAIESPTPATPNRRSSDTSASSLSNAAARLRELTQKYQEPSSERSERIISNLRSIASDFIDEQKRKTPVSSLAEEIRRAVDRANSAS